MSMESGFELDFPGNDDNADNCKFGCMPMDHGIGEPDAASMDEMPRPFVPEEVREDDYWEKTRTEISRTRGYATHRLSFITSTRYGADTTTVRLTQAEMIETWYAIGQYFGLMPR
jgi:hypothetical protein